MHVCCYENVTELCAIAIGFKNVFSLFGDVTLEPVVLREIMVWTEMAISDYAYPSKCYCQKWCIIHVYKLKVL